MRDHLAAARLLGKDITAEDVPALLGPGARAPDGARRARARACSTRSCAASGVSLASYFGSTRTEIPTAACRWASRTTTRSTRSLTEVEGYVAPGLQADQAEDPARVGRRAHARGTRALARHAAAGRRQPGVRPRRHRPPLPARRVRPAAHRAADPRGGPPRAQAARGADAYAGLPRRVGAVGRQRRARSSTTAPARSSTSRPAASAATSRRRRSTTWRAHAASRSGAAAWWRPVWVARPTSPSRRCPGSRCPATRARRHRFFTQDVTEPFVMDDGRDDGARRPGSRRARRSPRSSRRSR